MRKPLFVAVLVVGAVSFGAAGEPNDCSTEVLPDGPKECRFRHVAAAAISHDGAQLSIRWPERYDVEDALLARDWKRLFRYEPGSIVRVELDPEHRYDFVARFTDRRTGETFLGVTSVGARRQDGRRSRRDVRLEPRSCTIATDVDCTDAQGNPAGTASVECHGDTGTCSDSCSDSETACCTSTSTTTERTGDGTVISSSTIQERQQGCD